MSKFSEKLPTELHFLCMYCLFSTALAHSLFYSLWVSCSITNSITKDITFSPQNIGAKGLKESCTKFEAGQNSTPQNIVECDDLIPLWEMHADNLKIVMYWLQEYTLSQSIVALKVWCYIFLFVFIMMAIGSGLMDFSMFMTLHFSYFSFCFFFG